MAKVLQNAGLVEGTALTKTVPYRILKQAHPDIGITENAAQYMVNLVTQVDQRIAAAEGKTYLDKVRAVLPGELYSNAAAKIKKAVAPDEKTPTYIQASVVAEYLTSEIFVLAGNNTRDRRRARISSLSINIVIRNDDELYILFKDNLPPDPLIWPDAPMTGFDQFKARKGKVAKSAVRRDLHAMFIGRKISSEVIDMTYNVVLFLQMLFGQVSDERYALWLKQIPIPDETVNLNERCYRKVMSLIVAGLTKYAPQGTLQYAHLVYAVTMNDHYDLSPYLRIKTLE